MFDKTKKIELRIMSGGHKACVVRFPTDAEWRARARAQRTMREHLGRGKSQYRVLNADDANADLFVQIRVDKDGPEFDAAEASAAIARLERWEPGDSEREGDTYRIRAKVPGAQVVYVLRMPKQSEMAAFSRASMRVIEGRRSQELRFFLEPGEELFDKLLVSSEGYAEAGGVPAIHKDAAVNELLAQIAEDTEEDDPEA
mgnify:CR=1 FL=1